MSNSYGETKLFVKNLPWSATDDSLWETFKEHGDVPFTRVCVDRDTGRSRGFGFVSFTNAEDAKKACDALNGFSMDGREIVVAEATERPAGGPQGPCFASLPAGLSR